jgi:hypothetical protein
LGLGEGDSGGGSRYLEVFFCEVVVEIFDAEFGGLLALDSVVSSEPWDSARAGW